MKINTRKADVNTHARAVRAASEETLKGVVSDLGDRTLRSSWERMRLAAARKELNRRKGKRR